MVNELLLGVIAALQFGVFAVLLAYVYLAESTTEIPGLKLYYPLGLTFLILSEFVFLVTQILPGGSGANRPNFGILIVTALTYLVSGVAVSIFVTKFHRSLTGE